MLFEIETGEEGIHSIEINGKTIVLMFEDKDDADRYCGLLEAQDFPKPSVEEIEREEVEIFCKRSGYETKFVDKGFIPQSDEERLLLTPPEKNLDVSNWYQDINTNNETMNTKDINEEIDKFRRRLEDLI